MTSGTISANTVGVSDCCNTAWSYQIGTPAVSSFIGYSQPAYATLEANCKETKFSGLYKVFVVEQDGEVVCEETVVADNEEGAKFKAGVYSFLETESIDIEDVTIVCNRIASVKVKR